jgi:hypothetical protein
MDKLERQQAWVAFASAALAGYTSDKTIKDEEEIVELSCSAADIMLAELENRDADFGSRWRVEEKGEEEEEEDDDEEEEEEEDDAPRRRTAKRRSTEKRAKKAPK